MPSEVMSFSGKGSVPERTTSKPSAMSQVTSPSRPPTSGSMSVVITRCSSVSLRQACVKPARVAG